MPSFPVEGGVLLALARGIWVGAMLSSLGTIAFWAIVVPRTCRAAPHEVAARIHRVLLRLSRAGLAAAGLSLSAWLWRQSIEITGSTDAASVLAVTLGTAFGHLVLLQFVGLAATVIALETGATIGQRWLAAGSWQLAAGFSAAVTALQAGHGHAFAQQSGCVLLLGSSVIHLLAAGTWLGGLLPLLLVVRVAPCRTGAAAARWFSPLGKWCVGLLAGSAAVEFYALIGGWAELTTTSYGQVALAKLVLFLILLGFAWVNRYRFAPRLLGPAGAGSRAVLIGSIAIQTGFGIIVILAASMLSSLPPPGHP